MSAMPGKRKQNRSGSSAPDRAQTTRNLCRLFLRPSGNRLAWRNAIRRTAYASRVYPACAFLTPISGLVPRSVRRQRRPGFSLGGVRRNSGRRSATADAYCAAGRRQRPVASHAPQYASAFALAGFGGPAVARFASGGGPHLRPAAWNRARAAQPLRSPEVYVFRRESRGGTAGPRVLRPSSRCSGLAPGVPDRFAFDDCRSIKATRAT